MANQVFETVVSELSFLGDILSVGIVKKGVAKEGGDPDSVTPQQMQKALDNHIIPAVRSFISPDKAKDVRSKIIRVLRGMN